MALLVIHRIAAQCLYNLLLHLSTFPHFFHNSPQSKDQKQYFQNQPCIIIFAGKNPSLIHLFAQLYIYMYVCMYVCMHVFMYMHLF